ncbi:MAG: DegT/DnrJ/EryC1/StrS family aminotransferase [Chloroflexi bacterium]|nr:DegT/DnrJ/EryC1/StrS family aminotransferase [Chloroflexota bacterium]
MSKLAINGGIPVRTEAWPQWPQWDGRERQGLMDVLESGVWGGFNEVVGKFEQAFGKRHQAKHCVTAANGSLSLEAALRVLDIGYGDEVIVPPYTFIATANAVRLVGATPVFVDIEADTYNLDATKIEEALSPKTKAIIPVHFGGLPADMDAIMALAQKHNLFVVEDAAHAHGSTWRGQPMGTIGHIGSFSLQASKNLTAGEGGLLLTNHDDLGRKLRSFVNQGRSLDGAWYEHDILGSNMRLSAWQAAILLAQLERFDDQLARRQQNARQLRSILEEIDGLQPMRWDERAENHSHHVFMMRYDPAGFNGLERDQFIEALKAEGVPCSGGYARPLYKQPPLSAEYSRIMPCPVSEQACHEVIYMSQNLLLAEPEQMDDIAQAIVKVRENIGELK